MSEILPFRGVRFNPGMISSIAQVVAPPYDVVDPALERKLTERDEHNIIRLTMGMTPPGGRNEEDFRRAAELLARWRRERVLVQDEEPSICVVEQTFTIKGEEFVRRGFIAAVKLEEFGEGNIYPHERTRQGPIADRLRLMFACRATLSQVLAIYSDPDGAVDRLVGSLVADEQLCAFRDDGGTTYTVGRVSDRGAIRRVVQQMRERVLVIADGHHRYECALRYRSLQRTAGSQGVAPEDFIPALCVSGVNPGLKTLPTHRCIKAARKPHGDNIKRALSTHFVVTETTVGRAEDLQSAFDEARRGDACVGCYLRGGHLYLLKPADLAHLRPRFPKTADVWWHLPVSMLHYVILPDLLGIAPRSHEESQSVEYVHDTVLLRDRVESGGYAAGFLLPQMDASSVAEIAAQRQRLPPKTTYFYPKMASGLVLYVHEAGTLGTA